jgi:hypothetical protein
LWKRKSFVLISDFGTWRDFTLLEVFERICYSNTPHSTGSINEALKRMKNKRRMAITSFMTTIQLAKRILTMLISDNLPDIAVAG